MSEVLNRIELAYSAKDAFEVAGTRYSLPVEEATRLSDSAALPTSGIAILNHFRTFQHPSGKFILDHTHPRARAAPGIQGELFDGVHLYIIGHGSLAAQRRDVNLSSYRATAVWANPSCLPSLVRSLVGEQAASSVTARQNGTLLLKNEESGSEIVVDAKDYTVLGYLARRPGAPAIKVSYPEFQETKVFAARFPKLGVLVPAGQAQMLSTATIFDPPLPVRDAGQFDLASYVRTIKVAGTNEVLEVDGTPLPDAPPQRPLTSREGMRIDPDSQAANAKDPAQPILPSRPGMAHKGLLSIGLFGLILVGAILARRRWA